MSLVMMHLSSDLTVFACRAREGVCVYCYGGILEPSITNIKSIENPVSSDNALRVKWCCLRVPFPSITAHCLELTGSTKAFKACYLYASSLASSHPPFMVVCDHKLLTKLYSFLHVFLQKKSSDLLSCFSLLVFKLH